MGVVSCSLLNKGLALTRNGVIISYDIILIIIHGFMAVSRKRNRYIFYIIFIFY